MFLGILLESRKNLLAQRPQLKLFCDFAQLIQPIERKNKLELVILYVPVVVSIFLLHI